MSATEAERHVYANILEGDRQLTLGDESKARFWFDHAVAIAPKDPATYLGPDGAGSGDITGGLISCLTQHNDWPDLELYLTKAVQIPEIADQWLVWSSLGQAQRQLGEMQASRRSYQRELSAMSARKAGALIASDPDFFEIQHADALWGSGQTAAGRDELLRLISHHPDIAPTAQNELAYLEAVGNVNLPEAENLARAAVEAVRQDGSDDEALGGDLDTLGWVEYRRKNYGPALTDLEEALDYIPREAVSHYHLAEVYQALGQTQAAQIEINRAAYLDPSDFDTKVALQQIDPQHSAAAPSPIPVKA